MRCASLPSITFAAVLLQGHTAESVLTRCIQQELESTGHEWLVVVVVLVVVFFVVVPSIRAWKHRK